MRVPRPQDLARAPDKASGLRYLAVMQPITTTKKLADTCARMARHPFVTVDTEFLRESTYYPQLCVAQMASTDEAVVVDALASGIDSTPFDQLVQRVTGDNLDKSHRFTDWTRLPLSEAQLVYAVSDVTHLRDVY